MTANKTEKAQRLHSEAMDFVTRALVESQSGAEQSSIESLKRRALALERSAAIATPLDMEPTRSVLFLSAASIALQLNELRDAEILAARGLAGQPSAEVRDKLRNLLRQSVCMRPRPENAYNVKPKTLMFISLAFWSDPYIDDISSAAEIAYCLEKLAFQMGVQVYGDVVFIGRDSARMEVIA